MYGIFQSSSNGTISLKFTQFEFPMTFKIVTNKPDYFIALACHDCGVFSQGGKGILIFCFCELVIAQVPIPANGKCPTFDNCTDKNFKFDAKLFLGYNYLISSVPYFFQVDQKCTWFNITQSSNTSLLMEKFEIDVETHKLRITDGIVDYKDDGNVLLKYTDLELPMNFKAVLVHPDYAVVLACNDCGFFSKTGAGIYAYGISKVPWPSCDIVKIINAKLNECGISNNYIKTENQDGCSQCKKP